MPHTDASWPRCWSCARDPEQVAARVAYLDLVGVAAGTRVLDSWPMRRLPSLLGTVSTRAGSATTGTGRAEFKGAPVRLSISARRPA